MRFVRTVKWLLVLLLCGVVAALVDQWLNPPKVISAEGQALHIADGDSFSIGKQKLRLKGIDAPEYHQTCEDAAGRTWECGKAARASLEQILRLPELKCEIEATDRYARSVATCRTTEIADISAAQVLGGMAVSQEYFGIRNYGAEEDSAKAARRGIWRGTHIAPSDWRDTHLRR